MNSSRENANLFGTACQSSCITLPAKRQAPGDVCADGTELVTLVLLTRNGNLLTQPNVNVIAC